MKQSEILTLEFLSGRSEMGHLIRNFDWSKTSLGPLTHWDQSLKTAVSICLDSRFPVILWWGKDLQVIYNDAWPSAMGIEKHPALEKNGKEVFPEVWDNISGRLKQVLQTGMATFDENHLLLLNRYGYIEETYWTYSLSPIRLNGGEVGGVFSAWQETSYTVIAGRQFQTLSDLRTLGDDEKTAEAVFLKAARLLEANNKDFPCVIIYKIDNKGNQAEAIAYAGIAKDHPELLKIIDLKNSDGIGKNVIKAITENKIVLSETKGRWKDIPKGAWDIMPEHFAHIPICGTNKKTPVAILTAALNPYRKFDDAFRNFVQLVADQISLELNNIQAVEEERKNAAALDEKTHEQVISRQNVEETITSLQLQSFVLEKMDEGVSVSDENGIILFTNSSENKMFGYEAGELIGKHVTIQNAYLPEENERMVADVISELKAKGSWSGEWHNRKKDGSDFYTNSFITSLLIDGKTLFVCVQRDITEEKMVKEKLAYRTALLEAQNEAIPAAILIIDIKGKIVSFNQHFINLWNIPRHIIELHKDVVTLEYVATQLVNPKDFIEHIRSVDSYPKEKTQEELFFKDGRILERNGNPVLGENGRKYGWAWYFRDITERKKSEAALKESEEQFRNFSNNIQNLAWIADGEGWIYWYNQRWYDYTGTNPEEMKGWGWQKVHHPEHVDRVLEYVKDAWKRPEPFEMIFPLKSKTGEFRWFLTRCVPIINQQGIITRWIGTNTDIHDQKIAEEKLLEKEQNLISAKDQLELTFQNIPAAVYLLNSSGEVLYLNERGARLFGDFTAAEILHDKDLASLIKRSEQIYERYNERGEPLQFEDSPAWIALKTGKPANRVLKVVHKQRGEAIWFYSQASPLLDGTGKVSLVLGTATDITSQKQAEEIIRESESRFRTLAETLPQMIWVRRMDGTMEYGSKSWEEYCGISDVREAWRTITHPDDWKPVMMQWQSAMEEGKPFNCEVRLKNKEGEYRWHNAVGEPVKDASGIVSKYIGALTDIHVQKTFSEKLEKLVAERTRELANLNMELQRSNEDLQQFAHVTSHDLKEPIRKVRTFNGRLREEFGNILPEKAKTYISKIENASSRIYSMIDGVLLYSSMNAMQQSIEKVNLNDIISQIETDLEVIISQKAARITYVKLPVIEGSFILMYQLFYNIINNSLKFGKADVPPAINITSEIVNSHGNNENDLNEYVKIMVQDNGIGFDNAEKEEIFKTFSRLNPKDKYEGTGLGLALCKKIVERHSGTIVANGMPGEGALMEIVLPKKYTSK